VSKTFLSQKEMEQRFRSIGILSAFLVFYVPSFDRIFLEIYFPLLRSKIVHFMTLTSGRVTTSFCFVMGLTMQSTPVSWKIFWLDNVLDCQTIRLYFHFVWWKKKRLCSWDFSTATSLRLSPVSGETHFDDWWRRMFNSSIHSISCWACRWNVFNLGDDFPVS
jgi:hypothetical protein